MKVIFFLFLVYFVAKGTISFSLSKEYLEKEIKEIKKNNNFGEIEMCLNEKLTYNIKVKSRNCELFVLKKNVISIFTLKLGLPSSLSQLQGVY